MKFNKNTAIIISIYSVLFLYVFLLFSQKIVFVTADLGRHIANGRLLFEKGIILSTNYYSYTEPNFPVVTHHWGFGAIIYALYKAGYFPFISFVYVLISASAFLIFFIIARQKSSISFAVIASLLAIPLVINRVEIRPEGLSYLITSLYLWLLFRYQSNKISLLHLSLILFVLQIIWVNTHIFFIFGPFLVGIFAAESFVKKRHLSVQYAALLVLLLLSSLINPFHIYGFFEPFTILREYGYMIVENQTIPFIQSRFHNYIYLHTELLYIVSGLSLLLLFFKKERKQMDIALLLLALIFGFLSWNYIRVIPFFGLFFIPFFSHMLYKIWRAYKLDLLYIHGAAMGLGVLVAWIGIGFSTTYSPFRGGRFGLGLVNGAEVSAAFFTNTGLQGPIFNNYDIGGYLIYYLYPKEKVFVDNRPEAYSVSFFKDVYIPAQEDEDKWKKLDNKYQFNVIYFYRHDATPWAQPFLTRRIQDPTWIPVWVDDYVIILVKNNEKNRKVIETYELPNEMFVISDGETGS